MALHAFFFNVVQADPSSASVLIVVVSSVTKDARQILVLGMHLPKQGLVSCGHSSISVAAYAGSGICTKNKQKETNRGRKQASMLFA